MSGSLNAIPATHLFNTLKKTTKSGKLQNTSNLGKSKQTPLADPLEGPLNSQSLVSIPNGQFQPGVRPSFTLPAVVNATEQPAVIDLTSLDNDESEKSETDDNDSEDEDAERGRNNYEGHDEPAESTKFPRNSNGQRSDHDAGLSPLPLLRNDHWDSLLPSRDLQSFSRERHTQTLLQSSNRSLRQRRPGISKVSSSTAAPERPKGKPGRPPLTDAEKLRRKRLAEEQRQPRGRPPKKHIVESTHKPDKFDRPSKSNSIARGSSPIGLRVESPQPSSSQTVSNGSQIDLQASRAWMQKYAFTPFVQQLIQMTRFSPPVTIVNVADGDGPPTNFTFVREYILGQGTNRIDAEARTGCTCRQNNGRNIGCEYLYCACIEDVATDDTGKPIGFAYHAINEQKGCLRNMYLEQRFAIYECNELCNCPAHCKNKVVQQGRKLPLEIFKTRDRGWGLRTPNFIRKGQFVDVYLGEVITDAEAKRREKSTQIQKDSYIFALDKFHDLPKSSPSASASPRSTRSSASPPPNPNLFVVDGEHMGGPTRFINHSCSPNLRIFAVSMVRGDPRVYELAFFAVDDIQPGEELTFDYLDKDDSDDVEDRSGIKTGDLEAKSEGMAKCRCGSENCRGWLWI